MKQGYVYILSNTHRTVFYIGVTSDLAIRLEEHVEKAFKNSFTARYNITDLIYYEEHERIEDAIDREKQLKNWKRAWKLNLIKKVNPDLRNLEHEL
jgi:putative endonuclease